MYYVYILLLENLQLYTGYTHDLKRRYIDHKTGRVASTRLRRPLKLLHYEVYLRESDARRRERFLKTTERKRLLRMQMRDLLQEVQGIL